MAAENRLIKQIKKYVNDREGKIIKIHQTACSESGVPDLLIMIPKHGRMYLVETKAPGKKPTPLQAVKIQQINDAGGHAFWIDNIEDFKKTMLMLLVCK